MSKHRAGPIGDCPADACRERVAEKATPFDDYREVARQNMFDELAKEPGRKRVAWALFKSAQKAAEQAEARCAALSAALDRLRELARSWRPDPADRWARDGMEATAVWDRAMTHCADELESALAAAAAVNQPTPATEGGAEQ